MAAQRRRTESGWILIPILVLMIPILGTAESAIVSAAVALVIVLAVGSYVARSVMTHRHHIRMEELEHQVRLSQAESVQLAQANRVIESNAARREMQELRQAIGDAVPPPPKRDLAARVTDLLGR